MALEGNMPFVRAAVRPRPRGKAPRRWRWRCPEEAMDAMEAMVVAAAAPHCLAAVNPPQRAAAARLGRRVGAARAWSALPCSSGGSSNSSCRGKALPGAAASPQVRLEGSCPGCGRLPGGSKQGLRRRRAPTRLRAARDDVDSPPTPTPASSSGSAQHVAASSAGEDASASETTQPLLLDGRPSPQGRLSVILSTALAFVICNMDKVNMSVAIIPMSQELGWSTSVAGLVQSSFFCGYAASQLPGGWLAQRFSGRTVLLFGVLLWSVGTALVPAVASCVPLLLLIRFLIGLGEGVAPPAATDLIAQAVPPEERSRAVATVFGGLNVGSVAGLVLAPLCIKYFGWESVFYIFGLAGIVWWAVFREADAFPPESANGTSQRRRPPGQESGEVDLHGSRATVHGGDHGSQLASKSEGVPWRVFFETPAVLALIWAHFCNDWGKYALQSWLPTFYKSALGLDLTQASQIAILPPIASVALSGVAAWAADSLIRRGVDITQVRKLMQSISFVAPALCLLAVCGLDVGLHPWRAVALLSVGLGLSSFSLAGLYCTHQDISPKYAGILLGITNTAGAIPGFLGTASTGVLYDLTQSWNLSLFAPAIFFYLAGALVWITYARNGKRTRFNGRV